jgi:hypothetical protein
LNLLLRVGKSKAVNLLFQRATRSTKQKGNKQETPAEDRYLDIDLSLKMFESEVLWSAYHLNDGNSASSQYMDSLFAKISETIENAKNMDVSYRTLIAFLN